MTFVQVIPQRYKNIINYHRPENELIITIQVLPPTLKKETRVELADSNHLKLINRARLEYQKGNISTEETVISNLKK